MSFRSGFVSIIGRPNVGKSTLLNKLVGQKVAIVTPKPQTTRNRILGIMNVPPRKGHPAGQLVLIDTPGIHKPDSSLNRKMMQEVHQALASRDLLLLLVDATEKLAADDDYTLELTKRVGGPLFLLLNKIDCIEKKKLLPMMARYSQLHKFKEIIPISALTGDGLDILVDKIIANLPAGPRYFRKNQVTDQPERFLAAEIVREKVLLATGQEVPYASAVVVDEFEEQPKLTRIGATIFCEREGQKGILIGRRGEMLKKIGTAARLEIEKRFGTRVFLELFVKVQPGWRESRAFVDQLDWRKQL